MSWMNEWRYKNCIYDTVCNSHFHSYPKHINFLVGFCSHHSFQTPFEHQSCATSYFRFWDAHNVLAYSVNYLVEKKNIDILF